MNDESSELAPARNSPEPRPLLVLRTDRGANGGKPSAAARAGIKPASETQTLVGSNGQTASVRFRTETRLEYSNP